MIPTHFIEKTLTLEQIICQVHDFKTSICEFNDVAFLWKYLLFIFKNVLIVIFVLENLLHVNYIKVNSIFLKELIQSLFIFSLEIGDLERHHQIANFFIELFLQTGMKDSQTFDFHRHLRISNAFMKGIQKLLFSFAVAQQLYQIVQMPRLHKVMTFIDFVLGHQPSRFIGKDVHTEFLKHCYR